MRTEDIVYLETPKHNMVPLTWRLFGDIDYMNTSQAEEYIEYIIEKVDEI